MLVFAGIEASSLARRPAVLLSAKWSLPSILFGVYHFAHSPPFNSWRVVAVLTAIGLVTGLFLLVSKDIYGTILLHNALAAIGLTSALEVWDLMGYYRAPQWPQLILAAIALAVLVALEALWVRREAILVSRPADRARFG